MKANESRLILFSLLMACLALLVASCSSLDTGIRARPFPSDMQYMPKEQLQTAMWVLAAEIQNLERLIEEPAELERSTRRTAVAATLERMRMAAKTLDEPGRSSQHPLLDQNLGAFMTRLERAQRAVAQEPPNYFFAGTVAGSCYLCHGQNYTQLESNPPRG